MPAYSPQTPSGASASGLLCLAMIVRDGGQNLAPLLASAQPWVDEIIIGDPQKVAKKMKQGMKKVLNFRREHSDAYYYNWLLKIDSEFQKTFDPTHENMSELELHKDLETHKLAANLRRAFSGIVAGNVKDEGIRAIEKHGLFEISGDKDIMKKMDALLHSFVEQNRMKLPSDIAYNPCYKIIT